MIAPFNDIDTAASLIDEYADELASVIIEPLQRIIPAKPAFIEGLQKLTAKHDIPYIFDEVATGFRLAYGGPHASYLLPPTLSAIKHIISNIICTPLSPVVPEGSQGGATSTRSPPTRFSPRSPRSICMAS